jgi:hypothetical protein
MNANPQNPKMKKYLLSLSIVPAMFIVGLARAEEEDLTPPPPPTAAGRQQMLEPFDTDGDGVLSAEERIEARAALQAQGNRPGGQKAGQGRPGPGGGMNRQEMMKRADRDGDGVISDEERAAMRAAMRGQGGPGSGGQGKMNRQQILERFDTDGDGQISAEEREAARASMVGRGPGSGRPDRAEMKSMLDTDGDGMVSDEERAAGRAARQGAGRKGPPAPVQQP